MSNRKILRIIVDKRERKLMQLLDEKREIIQYEAKQLDIADIVVSEDDAIERK